jgi:drug/metabolite transporter (DMT)-like permease
MNTNSDLGGVGLGLLSSLSWGSGDFTGALASRRAPVYAVIITSQLMGLALLVVAAVGLQQPIPPLSHFLLGTLAGITGAAGLAALYYALARGKMAVTAPVSAVVGAMVPVLVGIWISGIPKEAKLIGFVLALASVWLVSQTPDTRIRLRDLALPVVAGISFGLFYVIMNRASSVSVLWPLVGARSASLSIFFIIAYRRRESPLVPRAILPLALLSGALDMGGNVFFVMAAEVGGRVDVAAVLASLFPVVTILLARLVLKEKIGRLQTLGIGLAVAAIVLISA